MDDDAPRDEPGRLPPGQSLTKKFPVVGEKEPTPDALDLATWRLTIDGLVDAPRVWSYPELMALPQQEREVDIHCVTGWSRLGSRFSGLPLSTLLAAARPLPDAAFVRFEAFSPRSHDTSLPLDVALADTWLAHAFEGRPLEPEHGFPFRTLTPSRYFYKSLKWVRRIELLAEDRLGYWERESSYHNVGDPWPGDQRFTSGSLRPDQAERFRVAGDFARFRGKVLLGLDLRGWRPCGRDLRALELKSCDLREAALRGCDLRGANFSLSNLRGADLGGADLRGADLEGADFAGADLRGADLRDTALSATRFFADEPGGRLAARVEGMAYEGASGLLEDQEEFLARAQASKA
jgi:DMSO/TMAO reductase YedYZ molybdopterin-dependent catalytic subunit